MAIPERFGRYRVDHELGRGGMDVVYAAYDDELDRHVAIKTIAEAATSEEARPRKSCSLTKYFACSRVKTS